MSLRSDDVCCMSKLGRCKKRLREGRRPIGDKNGLFEGVEAFAGSRSHLLDPSTDMMCESCRLKVK